LEEPDFSGVGEAYLIGNQQVRSSIIGQPLTRHMRRRPRKDDKK
jgi:hypothetical protein